MRSEDLDHSCCARCHLHAIAKAFGSLRTRRVSDTHRIAYYDAQCLSAMSVGCFRDLAGETHDAISGFPNRKVEWESPTQHPEKHWCLMPFSRNLFPNRFSQNGLSDTGKWEFLAGRFWRRGTTPSFEPDRPSLSDRGRASVAYLLSFKHLVCPAFCDTGMSAAGWNADVTSLPSPLPRSGFVLWVVCHRRSRPSP
jgi:hypothetical protein